LSEVWELITAYPERIHRPRDLLAEYRAKKISVSDLQSAIWQTAEAVVSTEDRDLQKCLQWAEGKLATLRLTTEQADIFPATLEVVNVVEERVQKALSIVER